MSTDINMKTNITNGKKNKSGGVKRNKSRKMDARKKGKHEQMTAWVNE